MLLQNKTVAIIGAGPVGLTMARLLQQQDVQVKVYERDSDPNARIWGGTLDMHKNSGQKAMIKAGLLERYYELSLPMGVTFVDERARVIALKPTAPGDEHDNPEINRNDLRTMLLDSLDKDAVVWDRKCIDIKEQQGRWLLQFENAPDAYADLVICANGGMSRIRSYVTDTQPVETGTIIIQADVPKPEVNCPEFFKLCNGNRLMVAHGGNLLVANPYNAGALTYGVIFQKPEDWNDDSGLNFQDKDSVIKYLSARFAGWDDRYHQLFNSTTFFVGLPTKKLPLDNPWKTDRPSPVTLIGDAAHLMPPFAGQGVNTGLIDALILSENLLGDKFQSIEAAISEYERQMFVYAGEAQRESSENEIQMRSPDFSFQDLLF